MSITRVITVLTLVKCFMYINNLELIPEAVKVVYANPKYVSNFTANVRRYGRNSSYYINAEATFLVPFDDNITSLEIIPEAGKIVFTNPKYLVNASMSIRRYGRHSPYYVNSEGTTLVAFDDNVTFDIIFYEYLHNEYRRSFVEFHFKGCRNVINDQFLCDIFKTRGIRCPLQPNRYVLQNMTFLTIPAVENLAYKWPFEKGKVVGTVRTYPEKEMIAEAYVIATFKESKPLKKKKN